MPTFVALVVAAGEGTRFKRGILKQYMPLGNKTVLSHTIASVFADFVHAVQVVIGKTHRALYENSLTYLPKTVTAALLPPVNGGNRRQDSVRIGLENIESINPDFVIIHDACRPLATLPDLDVITQQLRHHSGVVPVLAPLDTISTVRNDTLGENIPRESIRIIQTPQIFRYRTILECHRTLFSICPQKHFTDDSSMLLSCGMSVSIIAGNHENFKITTYGDLARAECTLGNS
ncbi:MAG: 2-C-methyl-D-erythritol 4-phosphate cytidylyltransferase [Aaplasma endosymbiont of Hyalomma asiaticum]